MCVLGVDVFVLPRGNSNRRPKDPFCLTSFISCLFVYLISLSHSHTHTFSVKTYICNTRLGTHFSWSIFCFYFVSVNWFCSSCISCNCLCDLVMCVACESTLPPSDGMRTLHDVERRHVYPSIHSLCTLWSMFMISLNIFSLLRLLLFLNHSFNH